MTRLTTSDSTLKHHKVFAMFYWFTFSTDFMFITNILLILSIMDTWAWCNALWVCFLSIRFCWSDSRFITVQSFTIAYMKWTNSVSNKQEKCVMQHTMQLVIVTQIFSPLKTSKMNQIITVTRSTHVNKVACNFMCQTEVAIETQKLKSAALTKIINGKMLPYLTLDPQLKFPWCNAAAAAGSTHLER